MSRAFFDVEARNELAARAGLMRDELLTQKLLGSSLELAVGRAQLDAAGLAAGTGVDLCFDDPLFAADLGGTVARLLGAVRQSAARNRHAELGEQLLGLVFVNVHVLAP